MCVVALQIAGTLLGAYGQYQQAQAQSAVYSAQAQQATENAKIINRQQESTADAYADKQSELRQRMAVARGQQAAAYGARGVEGGSGSALDVLAGSYEAYGKDSRNLLSNQRNDNFNLRVDEVNALNQASQYRAASDNAMQAGKIGALTTIVGGAANTMSSVSKYKPFKSSGPKLSGSAGGAKPGLFLGRG